MPRRGGPITKRGIPNVKRVVVVGSGKGGVGKSTTAVNLAFALAMRRQGSRVGVLDLDVFGPSIPKLMGLENADEPELTPTGALVPISNHGLPCMSMGFLLPRTPANTQTGATSSNVDTPLVWRGLMVQKAVQQLLFDVDWRANASSSTPGHGLDVLVVDLPPGTGDVQLTLGQLVKVDGAVIVSTPQDVALNDVRKGVAMFRKVDVPITGLLLNTSHTYCPSCSEPHYLFGTPNRFRSVAAQLGAPVLGELPLVSDVSTGGDAGAPYILTSATLLEDGNQGTHGRREWRDAMDAVATRVWNSLTS